MIGRLKLRGKLHQAQRFAIAFRLGHAEVAQQLLLGIAAFLLADDHHGLAVEVGHAADDGGSSPKKRSPCSSSKSVKMPLI